MANLLPDYEAEVNQQKADLVAQVLALAESNDLEGLAALSTTSDAAAALLADAMSQLAHYSADVASQENGGDPLEPAASVLSGSAAVVAGALAAELAVSASRAALRELGTGRPAHRVADAVRDWLNGLSSANVQVQLGGALHGALNSARLATFEHGPQGALYGHEVNDRNTCPPCREVNGRWLGNTDQMSTVVLSYPEGAYGGYVHCEGGSRCRGTIFGVWRQQGEEQ